MAGLCKRAGIPRLGWHALRRFFSSVMVDKGTPLKSLQELLGHTQAGTTERYLYRLRSDLRESVGKFDEMGIFNEKGDVDVGVSENKGRVVGSGPHVLD